jgi:hypothetical protein
MAPYFVFPQNLKSLEEENEDNRLHVLNPTDVASLRLPELEEFVKGQFYPYSIPLITLMLSCFTSFQLGISCCFCLFLEKVRVWLCLFLEKVRGNNFLYIYFSELLIIGKINSLT